MAPSVEGEKVQGTDSCSATCYVHRLRGCIEAASLHSRWGDVGPGAGLVPWLVRWVRECTGDSEGPKVLI
jgi:hypothetical protein